jgi:hypothetical protein
MKIYAPVKDATGIWCTVRFVNGVGETDDPKLINWFKNHGYQVEDNYVKSVVNPVIEVVNDQIDEVKNEDDVVKSEPNFEEMTPNELRDYMKANGLGSKIKNIRNKEKLLEILRG